MNKFDSAVLNETQKAQIKNIKERAEVLLAELEYIPDCREKSLAITKLEECLMWANKGVSRV